MTFLPPFFAAASSGGLLGALGIDWKALVLNTIAFLIILGLLGKYVYPILNKALDAKADELTAATRLQAEAKAELDQAEAERQRVLSKAQSTADEVVNAAKIEASETIASARAKATLEADRIIAASREQLDKDVDAARRTLRAETALLVASATSVLIEEKLDNAKDQALINRTLELKP
jgi:F-type H+-transporting ATPase subunit b